MKTSYPTRLAVSVLGDDTLAKATYQCCRPYFQTFNYPNNMSDVIWCCWDTPIGEDDKPDVEWVLGLIRNFIPHTGTASLILISSQLPIGSTAKLEEEFPTHTFAYQPENVRAKTALEDFKYQPRMVVGIRSHKYDAVLSELLGVFTANVIFTDPETAEMSKAALNTFLALQIAFINEIAKICKIVGANPQKVSECLKTDSRVSLRAPLNPGAPYGVGHLAREIYNLTQIAEKADISVPIISNIKKSNDG